MTAFEVLAAAAAVATGLAGGVLFAFSGFVMAGLQRLTPDAAAAAMRGINVTAVRPPLMILLLAAVVLPAATGVIGLVTEAEGAWWALAAALLTFVGVLAVTGLRNVPLNDRLAAAEEPGVEWVRYVGPWLRWNHVRTAAGGVASLVLAVIA
ncbi:anthrone oxygenase family protein [Isoptericola sediminis]|uniref:DUF1772 domain-containing protein n=1 Tax=Isoptericola sediminis TaxID=2733572 RepID=A0A849K6C7_9MICO|nr:anthrone oxygenase family protein [Isoptericola sediminis]NNU27325.1 DUF1772 domain-containing protein [Isoptericola sediminis]